MNINKKWQGISLAVFLTMILSPVFVQGSQKSMQQDQSQFLPQVMQQGKIAYTTGGYGLDERQALKDTAKNYNLIVSNALKGGEFSAGETISIAGKNNRVNLVVKDAGPLFYSKLPPGTYVVTAANGNEKSERTVTISGKKQARVYFIWSE